MGCCGKFKAPSRSQVAPIRIRVTSSEAEAAVRARYAGKTIRTTSLGGGAKLLTIT